MKAVKLTKKLISIPSFVDQKTDERKIGEFICGYLKQFKWLEIEKQPVINGRFNIIAKDKYPTSLLLCGHMDTVQPKQGWKFDQSKEIEKDGKIYGLGATDMKGNVAALLSALDNLKETKGLMMLFYIDEEYDFWGMKKFIKKYQTRIKPKLIVSLDGSDLKIGNGCRGLIEVSFTAQGKTGHAARPEDGKNAILRSTKAIEKLISVLKRDFSDNGLGITTCNLAYLRGGLNLGRNRNGNLLIGKEGNNIADVAEFVLDVRPATEKLNASKLVKIVKNYLETEGLKLLDFKIRHDLGSWLTLKKSLKNVKELIAKTIPVKYTNIGKTGYIDTQMLWEAFSKVPCFTFGAGENRLAHRPNEYIKITELKKCQELIFNLISQFANGK